MLNQLINEMLNLAGDQDNVRVVKTLVEEMGGLPAFRKALRELSDDLPEVTAKSSLDDFAAHVGPEHYRLIAGGVLGAAVYSRWSAEENDRLLDKITDKFKEKLPEDSKLTRAEVRRALSACVGSRQSN